MQELFAQIAVDDRDRRLRRSAEAWRHLHPRVEAPEVLPLDVDRGPAVRSAAVRWARWRDARRAAHRRPVQLTPSVRPSITRG
jgi:hypothetical protein